MTIKELEDLVGMPRANIRFYEEEGLITPARQPNGYRDYSRADADTLAKIKLFRQLHLDLDTIRALQSEELTLTQALEKQLAALETDQAALDRARQVCRQLRESGASYAALDPRPWLEQLERAPVPESARYAPPQDRYEPPASARHPWRRYFARSIDRLICGLIWLAILTLGFHMSPPNGPGAWALNIYMGWAILLLLEPICLCLFGTTPGKAVFGITVRHATGRKLTWSEALRRTWGVFGKGCGYGAPFYSLWRGWKSFKACREGEREPWEEDDGWESYEFADVRAWRGFLCAGAYALYFALALLIILQSLMPPHRGELTAAQFYENYNFYLNYLNVSGYSLDENGQWEIPQRPPTFDELFKGPDCQIQLTLTGDRVTAVTVVYEAETDKLLWLESNTEAQLALLAYAGSLPQINCLNFRATDWLDILEVETRWDYTTVMWDGLVRITQATQMDGFQPVSHRNVLHPLEGTTATFYQTFRIEPVT